MTLSPVCVAEQALPVWPALSYAEPHLSVPSAGVPGTHYHTCLFGCRFLNVPKYCVICVSSGATNEFDAGLLVKNLMTKIFKYFSSKNILNFRISGGK